MRPARDEELAVRQGADVVRVGHADEADGDPSATSVEDEAAARRAAQVPRRFPNQNCGSHPTPLEPARSDRVSTSRCWVRPASARPGSGSEMVTISTAARHRVTGSVDDVEALDDADARWPT